MADVTIAGVAIGAIGRSATLDATKIGLAAAIETTQSGRAIETRRATGDVARRCGRKAAGWKASDRSGRRTTEGRTTGTEARRRTRGRPELRECGVRRGDGGAEQHARGQGQQSFPQHSISPLS